MAEENKRFTADGTEIPSSYLGKIENYKPNYKKPQNRSTADGTEIPPSYLGKIENYKPNYKKSQSGFTAPSWCPSVDMPGHPESFNPNEDTGTMKPTNKLVEPDHGEPEIDYLETDSGVVQITPTVFSVEGVISDLPYLDHFTALKDEDDKEEIAGVLFYLGSTKDINKYYYIGDAIEFFTTFEKVIGFKYDGEFQAVTVSGHYALPDAKFIAD